MNSGKMDSDEEWFFDSVKNYKDLFMYDLQHHVTCMDWINNKNLIVATSSVDRNEVIELSVPDKLVSDDGETANLSKDRDFHQTNGGFSTLQICCVKHIPQSRQVCTSNEVEPGIQVWQLGSKETDLIIPVNKFTSLNTGKCNKRSFDKIAVCDNKPSLVVFGSSLNTLCCLNLDNQKVTALIEGPEDNFISEIKFIDENTVLCCSEKSGEIILIDLRNNKKDSLKITNKKDCYKDNYWTMDVMVDTLYRLSSAGNIILSDLRNGANNVYKEVETCHRSRTNQSGIVIKASPQHRNRVSISGFDGNIYIYDTIKEPIGESEYLFTESIFKHEGHVKNCSDQSDNVKTVAHLWHPCKPDLLMSSATDGSLHAWEYCLSNS